ncbi:MAG: hypothetical protein JXB46_05040 [Candidatus Eisenbacteria bacterium]|nr:hypothetical protein [Candidatus Eisenbacteria bacterium]
MLLALAGALVAVVLGLGEAALRVLAAGHNMSVVEYEPVRGWHGRPNARLVFDQPSFSIDVAQNSLGYRDRERAVMKPPGAVRILCCGDSFTWGWGVQQDQIYTHLLEEMCDRTDPRTEVINAGVSGQNTSQALLGLLDHGFAFSPDLVIYQASDNDIEGNLPASAPGIWVSPHHILGEDGELVIRGSPVPPPTLWSDFKYRAALHSRLAYLLRHRLHILATRMRDSRRDSVPPLGPEENPERQARPSGWASPDTPTAGDPADQAFRLFCAIVVRMDRESRQRGARFAVLIDFPLSDVRQDYWNRHCGQVEAHFVNGYLVALEKETGRRAFIERDGHWTSDGHKWIAEYLFENVARPLVECERAPTLQRNATRAGDTCRYQGTEVPTRPTNCGIDNPHKS